MQQARGDAGRRSGSIRFPSVELGKPPFTMVPEEGKRCKWVPNRGLSVHCPKLCWIKCSARNDRLMEPSCTVSPEHKQNNSHSKQRHVISPLFLRFKDAALPNQAQLRGRNLSGAYCKTNARRLELITKRAGRGCPPATPR